MPTNVPIGPLQSVDEAQSSLIARLTEVVFNGLVDVTVGQLTRDNRLRFHRRELARLARD